MLGVVAQVVFNERGNEEIAVIVARLAAQRQRMIMLFADLL